MLQTPLLDLHRDHNARLVDFAGWEMPIMYTGIVEEHQYTRQHCTMFDVSHMGRVEFRGPDAERFLEWLNTRNIGTSQPGMCRYSHMCREDGGILDDVIVSRAADHFLVVCNASNRTKLLAWWEQHRSGFNVDITDRTFETAMVALQGPEALSTLSRVLPLPLDLAGLRNYRFLAGNAFGLEYFIARSGYTGEDGFEIILPVKLALSAARLVLSQSAEIGAPIRLAGLGARDTLRLEAGMPLYGHELSEDWDSLSAGQGWAVDLSKDFIGRDTLARLKEQGPARLIAGLELSGKRIARQGAAVLSDGEVVGTITSGTQSPTLGRNIALTLIRSDLAVPGTAVEVDIRGRNEAAAVVPLPFYKRPR
ncbi:MAG: glycine cleavage system aminomethyltransferase GcvT [Phycisphaerales bacterium]|nr:glycine cleavage system aminomethyltransferase GcvT [Phycisphaerales bacterium]